MILIEPFVASYNQNSPVSFAIPRIPAAIVTPIVAMLLFSAFAYPEYSGSLASFLLFDVSFVTMLVLASPRPRSQAYLFFALMLFLGFWLKLMLHMVFGVPFLEPIGNFAGSPDAWDRALNVASIAAIGISIARVIHLVWSARSVSGHVAPQVRVPSWYLGWRKTIWVGSTLTMLALNVLNLQFAFYQTGVNPRLVLPHHLNVPLGWLINIGFALWFSMLIHWELQNSPRNLSRVLGFPVLEGLVSSTFALSRSLYFLHTVPYIFALASDWSKHRVVLSRCARIGLVVSWALCFVASLALASWLRINIFHLAYVPVLVSVPGQAEIVDAPNINAPRADAPKTDVPTGGNTMAIMIRPTFHQVSKLFLNRWIGLEGVLAVSSYPRLGAALVSDGFRSPKEGNESIYQVISKSGYEVSERFTFGSLPGVVGVLFYSGSVVVVGVGAMLAALLMMMTEFASVRFTANPFFRSIVALGMAHVACQVQFPYLLAIYVAQLWVAIAFVWLLSPKVTNFRVGGASA